MLFFFDTDDRATPRRKYITGLIVCRAGKIHSDISPTPSLIFTGFTGLKSTKFGLNVRPQSPLKHPGFKTEQLKGCLYYDTCTTYMCAAHVRRTCATNVYTMIHVRRTTYMYSVHVS